MLCNLSFNVGFGAPLSDLFCSRLQLPMYACPSDRSPAFFTGDQFYRVRGNYVLNWGPGFYRYNPANSTPQRPIARAPFGFEDWWDRSKPLKTTFGSLTDGTSNTLMMSEQIVPRLDATTDHRGDIINDNGAGNIFMTLFTPNSGIDNLRAAFCPGPSSPSHDPTLPCQPADGELLRTPHGVVIQAEYRLPCAMGRFNLYPTILCWPFGKPISTANGGEVIESPF